MKKTNVLIILPSYSIGGAEKIALTYFNNFKNSKISLKLLVINSIAKADSIRDNRIIHLNFSRFIFSVPTLINILKKFKIKVVISTFPNISAVLLILKRLKIINNRIIVRQPNVIEKSLNGTLKLFILRKLYKRLIKFANAVIVTSTFMREEALKNKVEDKKIFIIRNPINVQETRKNINPIRRGKDNIKLIFVGRLVKQKGIDRILHIFKENHNIEITIVGDGVLKEKLIEKTKNLNIEKKVNFIGLKKNPYNLIAGADYLILPSRWEGLPNCVLESLALGTPVLSTKEVKSLIDFKKNISNKSILLFDSIKELSNQVNMLKKRKDHLNPQLRNSLLIDNITPVSYNKRINSIIFNVA